MKRGILMNYHEFIKKIEEMIIPKLSEGEKIEVTSTIKNNNTLYRGILFQNTKTNLCTIIYLEPFFVSYQEGNSLECIVDEILAEIQTHHPQSDFDISSFVDFDKAKEHIFYKLINYEMNKSQLYDVPHIRFFDLAIVFCFLHSSEELGIGTILIHDHHLDMWNVTAKKVADIAKSNTPKLLPPMFCELKDLLAPELTYFDFDDEAPIHFYFLGNQKKISGASAILYSGMLSSIAQKLQQDFFIIPCSIHECLILSKQDAGDYSAEDMHNLIRNMNQTELSKDEILSDYPFFYDYKANTLTQLTSFE